MNDLDLPDDGPLLSQIGDGEAAIKVGSRKAFGHFFAQTGVRIAIFVAALASTYLTFRLPRDEFLQSLCSNLAAGLLVFLAAAPLLRGVRRHQAATLSGGVLFTGLVLGGAFVSAPVLQSLLLNIGVGAALVLALDLNIARWLDATVRAESEVRGRIDEAAAKVQSAQSTLDYKYAVHDMLGLPRPYKFGGISLAEGEHLMPQYESFAPDEATAKAAAAVKASWSDGFGKGPPSPSAT